jgi:uncharacterized iron-regulated membrane protein
MIGGSAMMVLKNARGMSGAGVALVLGALVLAVLVIAAIELHAWWKRRR